MLHVSLNVFFIAISLFFFLGCKNTKTLPKDASLRMVFYSLVDSSQICIFHINFNSSELNNLCTSELITGIWAEECVVYSNFLEEDFEKYPAKVAYNQLLRTLSYLELNYNSIKKQLDSILVIAHEGKMLENEKLYLSEFKNAFEKFKIKGYVKNFLKDQEVLILGNNLFQNSESSLLLMMNVLEAKFLALDEPTAKRKVVKDKFTSESIWQLEEKKGSEFAACRQAFSKTLRSTGKSGIENANLCREIIRNQLQTSKLLQTLKNSSKQKLYVYGETWAKLSKIIGSQKIQKSHLEQKQSEFCYLSGLELIQQKKLPKEISLQACYLVSFGIEYLESIGYTEAELISSYSFSQAASTSTDIFPECNPKFSIKK
jgi:uncharacterized protein YnzC (UPF0291/DUF896 family)